MAFSFSGVSEASNLLKISEGVEAILMKSSVSCVSDLLKYGG